MRIILGVGGGIAAYKSAELARLLMECSFCQRREVAYLNELELKSFEIRKCIARVCRHCDSPSIWIESQSELRPVQNGPGQPAVGGRELRRRQDRFEFIQHGQHVGELDIPRRRGGGLAER